MNNQVTKPNPVPPPAPPTTNWERITALLQIAEKAQLWPNLSALGAAAHAELLILQTEAAAAWKQFNEAKAKAEADMHAVAASKTLVDEADAMAKVEADAKAAADTRAAAEAKAVADARATVDARAVPDAVVAEAPVVADAEVAPWDDKATAEVAPPRRPLFEEPGHGA